MPRGDGNGPPSGRQPHAGRMGGNRAGSGPGGECRCPACGEKADHQPGVPCYDVSCPKCGTKMVRN